MKFKRKRKKKHCHQVCNEHHVIIVNALQTFVMNKKKIRKYLHGEEEPLTIEVLLTSDKIRERMQLK